MTERRMGRTGRLRLLPAALMWITLIADITAVGLVARTTVSGKASPVDIQLVIGLVLAATYGIVGWIIASRRPDNAIGWVFLVIGLSQAIEPLASAYAQVGLVVDPGSLPLADLMSWVAVWAWAPGFTLLVTLSVLLFPDGRLPSRRWRPIVWAAFVVMGLLLIPVAVAAFPLRGSGLLGGADAEMGDGVAVALALEAAGVLLAPFVALASIAGMFVRYRRGGPTERQQLKWFTYAAVPEIAFILSTGYISIPQVPGIVASFAIAPLLPAAAAIAIFRYDLYDIDRIVSRTIAYVVITGTLVAAYAAIILVLQSPLGTITGGDTVSVALSTLVVAALFQPLRRRVQGGVDRRFDRARYDAERTTTAFSVRLRDEVDLASVTADLGGTVDRAVAPSSIGVWLRVGGRR